MTPEPPPSLPLPVVRETLGYRTGPAVTQGGPSCHRHRAPSRSRSSGSEPCTTRTWLFNCESLLSSALQNPHKRVSQKSNARAWSTFSGKICSSSARSLCKSVAVKPCLKCQLLIRKQKKPICNYKHQYPNPPGQG